ncbi:hypothetical protein L226DRAFT_527822 [Lentinus tigrinus ALCF2SS1-7]|uniref:uncharacterized protein n=1 Tax=Lentinus tigrinus ALCF2SS1-7 TaxID=1328758 RepID=UPI00116636B3|nr:hypothetical protein L226DRAFT_527822 [Lentinus tigrinus ALCF2SS1-7]
MLSIPTTAQQLLTGTDTPSGTTPGLLAPATSLLASSTLTHLSSNPLVLDRIVGPDTVVEPFLTTWSALLLSLNLRVHIHSGSGTAFNGSRVSYATRASLKPPPSASPAPSPPFPHPIVQASTADLETIAQLYIAFQADEPWHRTIRRSAALACIEGPVKAGLVWYVPIDGPPGGAAGYVLLGRASPRTIAIRNVFVSRSHRRKGVAEAMVRGVTRYYLNAPPHGVRPLKEGPPAVGFKEEVHLNVSDESAERVYRRAGFLFPDRSGDVVAGGVDPVSGRKSWYALARREIERVQEPL